MVNEELVKIKTTAACLDHSVVDSDTVSLFCRTLKKSCEELRKTSFKGEKKAEQAFCLLVIEEIIKKTLLRAKAILSNRSSTPEGTLEELNVLIYSAQSLIALTKIQHRFGGRLGYHCLPHSQLVALYPDPLVMCAGANHDAVMRYQSPPNFDAPEIKKLKDEYHALRSAIASPQDSLTGAHQLMYASFKDKIKALKGMTEQKRRAGWQAGHSEYDSYIQMEVQLAELINIIEASVEERQHQRTLDRLKKRLQVEQGYRGDLIKGTIANRNDFAAPGLGDKLNTIGNATVFPGPAALVDIEQPLRNRLVRLIDRVIIRLRGPNAPTFRQALVDIEDAKTFYHRVGSARTDHPFKDLEGIKMNVRRGMRKEKGTDQEPLIAIPHFETMDETLLSSMPPFNDPLKPLKDISQEVLIESIKDQMLQDAKENGDLKLFEFFRQRVKTNIVGNQDLGSLMKKEAIDDVQSWIVGLVAEENPYQARFFFSLHQRLLEEGGLADDRVLRMLGKEDERKKRGISEEEYRGALEFIDFTYYYMNENLPFSSGAILRIQLYIYVPMKALQKALEDPVCTGCFPDSDIRWFHQTVNIFEDLFCKRGRIRDGVLQKLNRLIVECSSASSLCVCILKAMEHQFGSHFLEAPGKYGYTDGNRLCSVYLQEQDNTQLL